MVLSGNTGLLLMFVFWPKGIAAFASFIGKFVEKVFLGEVVQPGR